MNGPKNGCAKLESPFLKVESFRPSTLSRDRPIQAEILFFRMKKARNLFLLIFNQLHGCFSAFTNYQHSVSCSESAQNGIEMKITVEKDFLEKNFPFSLQEFKEINGFYQKTVFQDQLEIEFENQDCKLKELRAMIIF